MAIDYWDNEEDTDGNFEIKTGFELIPEKSTCLMMIEGVSIKPPDDNEPDDYICIDWVVIQPEEYESRKVSQKIRYLNEKDTKRKKAFDMLKSIDFNAGGKLRASDTKPSEWDDKLLSKCLNNKQMLCTVMIYEFDKGEGKTFTGNWISKVAPKNSGKPEIAEQKPKQQKQTKYADDKAIDEDDIPF